MNVCNLLLRSYIPFLFLWPWPWPDDLGILKMYMLSCLPKMKFLGQGFQNLEHANRTDRHTDRQRRSNALAAAFVGGNYRNPERHIVAWISCIRAVARESTSRSLNFECHGAREKWRTMRVTEKVTDRYFTRVLTKPNCYSIIWFDVFTYSEIHVNQIRDFDLC